jgi:hypothetical protein
MIPRGAEFELAGEATPEFLGVYYAGRGVWVPAHDGGGWIDERELSR